MNWVSCTMDDCNSTLFFPLSVFCSSSPLGKLAKVGEQSGVCDRHRIYNTCEHYGRF